MIPRFKFAPQPALDKAIAGQKEAEEAVVAARRALEEEKKRLQRMLDEIEMNRQRIRREHDNLASPRRQVSDPRELTQISRFIDSLRAREKQLVEAAERQRQKVAFAGERVQIRLRELAEAVSRVQALEKLKEQRRQEHEAAVEKAEEKQRDDEAIQRWNTRGAAIELIVEGSIMGTSLPAIPPVPPRNDEKAVEEDPAAEQRNTDVAQNFRTAMSRTGNAEILPSTNRNAPRANRASSGAPLSPAMFRLEAQGVPISSGPASSPPQHVDAEIETVGGDEDPATSQPPSGGSTEEDEGLAQGEQAAAELAPDLAAASPDAGSTRIAVPAPQGRSGSSRGDAGRGLGNGPGISSAAGLASPDGQARIATRTNSAGATGAPLSPAMLRLAAQGVPISPRPATFAQPQPVVSNVEQPVVSNVEQPVVSNVEQPVEAEVATGAAKEESRTTQPQSGGVVEKDSKLADDGQTAPGLAAAAPDAGRYGNVGPQPTVLGRSGPGTQTADQFGAHPRPATGLASGTPVPARSLPGRSDAGPGHGKEIKSSSATDPRLPAGEGVAAVGALQQSSVGPAQGPALTLPSGVLQQLVQFATVHQNNDGFYEFQLGLNENVLGGLQIQVAAYGNRRVGLKVRSARGASGGIGEEEVAGLIAALRSRGVDVVDVDMG